MAVRQCPFCGKYVQARLRQCSSCRETLPPAPRIKTEALPTGGAHIRRGLLFMLLAALIGYFAGGYSAWRLPIPVLVPVLTNYLSPLLFLSGLGLLVHGYYLQHKSSLHHHSV